MCIFCTSQFILFVFSGSNESSYLNVWSGPQVLATLNKHCLLMSDSDTCIYYLFCHVKMVSARRRKSLPTEETLAEMCADALIHYLMDQLMCYVRMVMIRILTMKVIVNFNLKLQGK
jgi:thioredoxin-related protein